jgi:hypothetical protein
MHRFIIFILLTVFFSQCKHNESSDLLIDIKDHNWGTRNAIVLENGYYHSYKTLDTITNQLTGDTLLPVRIHDQKLILEKLEPLHMELRAVDGIEDFYITSTGFKADTFEYDVKKFADKYFLVLISPNSASQVYELKDKDLELSETNNISFPRYEIEGYTVGDEINRTEIQVLFKDQFGTSLTEEAILVNNENVLLKIIAGKYIEEIRWMNLPEKDILKIVKDLNSVFSSSPGIEYIPEEERIGSEDILQYFWSENDTNILLTKATETGDIDEFWSLIYTDLILSNIMNNYLDASIEAL